MAGCCESAWMPRGREGGEDGGKFIGGREGLYGGSLACPDSLFPRFTAQCFARSPGLFPSLASLAFGWFFPHTRAAAISPPLHSSVSASGLWATCNANSEEEGCEKEPFSTSSSTPFPPSVFRRLCWGFLDVMAAEGRQTRPVSCPSLFFFRRKPSSLSLCLLGKGKEMVQGGKEEAKRVGGERE